MTRKMLPTRPAEQQPSAEAIPINLVKPWKLPPQNSYLFTNANIVDPDSGTIIRNQCVRLANGIIESVGPNVSAHGNDILVDLAGRYLCPGLIDCHVHLTATAGDASLAGQIGSSDKAPSLLRQPFLCKQILSRGFTTVRDTGGATLALKEALADDVFPGPRLFICNKALSQTGGHGDDRGPHDHSECCGGQASLSQVIDGVPQCLAATRTQMRTGADFIKIMVGGGVASPTDKIENRQFTSDEIRAIVDVADSYGTYVTAHAYTPMAIRHAVDNGVMGIEHGNLIDKETAQYMAEKKVWLTPTLITYKAMSEPQYGDFLPPENQEKNQTVLAKGIQALRIAKEAGVTICHGTDLLGPLHAEQSREFGLRAQALESVDVLRSATINAARMLKQEKTLGQIKEGFAADLLVLNRNPLQDVTILDTPEKHVLVVMKNGRVYTSRWSGMQEDVSKATAIVE